MDTVSETPNGPVDPAAFEAYERGLLMGRWLKPLSGFDLRDDVCPYDGMHDPPDFWAHRETMSRPAWIPVPTRSWPIFGTPPPAEAVRDEPCPVCDSDDPERT